jgi:FkbM family methyltransferase
MIYDDIIKNLKNFHCQDSWKFCKNFANIRNDAYGLRLVNDKIDYFIDIGSCLGEVAYTAYQLLRPNKIIAIEPAHNTFECLKKNIGHLPNTFLENKAIYHSSGTLLNLILNPYNIGENLVINTQIEEYPVVESISFDDILIKYNINYLKDRLFIKIDCEGSEIFILNNPKLFYCQQLSIEIHERRKEVKSLCDMWYEKILQTHKIIKGKRCVGKNYEIIFQKKS